MSLSRLRKISKAVVRDLTLTKDNVDTKCAIVSAYLFEKLKRNNVLSVLHLWAAEWPGMGHCFVSTEIAGKEYVIDLTYTQFVPNEPLVLIENFDSYKIKLTRQFGENFKMRKTKSLRYFICNILEEWPCEQTDIKHYLEKFKN
jgi:hypothetical protein